MRNLQKTLKFFNTRSDTLQAVDDESTFNRINFNKGKPKSMFAEKKTICGIIFDDGTGDNLPATLSYTIRRMFSDNYLALHGEPKSRLTNEKYATLYNDEGVLFFQYYVDKIYTGMATGKLDKNTVSDSKELQEWFYQTKYKIENFPFPAMEVNTLHASGQMEKVWTMIVVGFIFVCPSLLMDIVKDNRSGITELMRLMGLSNIAIWGSWLLKVMMVNVIPVSIVAILLTAPPPKGIKAHSAAFIEYGSGFLIWLFLIMWLVASVILLFLISSIIHRPIFALLIGCVVWIIDPSFYQLTYTELSFSIALLFCLFPLAAGTLGWLIIIKKENRGTGLHFNNLFESEFENKMKMIHIFLMLLVSMFFWGLLTLYIESIYPGKYGVRQPWLFPVTSIYNRLRGDQDDDDDEADVEGGGDEQANYEAATPNLKSQIQIQNLRKKFRRGNVTAVDGVTIDIYENQITVLLGHNGAGKTTLLSIITGMISFNSGVIKMNGIDLRKNMKELRKSLGLCPQHDMFFEYLTVNQHLILFGILKGVSYRKSKAEAKKYLETFGMSQFKKHYPFTLSGGTRRKLSLGMAFVGKPKVVVLDEPTSWMDPGARRKVWNILLDWRGKTTVIITTHVMEEADVLADRIAIMDRGKIKCYGTSLYLKKKYGSGFRLTVMTNTACDVKLTNLIKNYVAGSSFKGRFGTELGFTLPENQKSSFPQLFDAIDEKRKEFGIVSFGVSPTSLEEVFLRVGEDTRQASSDSATNERRPNQDEPSTGCPLTLQRCHALFIKVIVCSCRSLNFLFTGILLVIVVILGMFALVSWRDPYAPVELSLNTVGGGEVYYSVGESVSAQRFAQAYASVVQSQGGKSTKIQQRQRVSQRSLVEFRETKETRDIFIQYSDNLLNTDGTEFVYQIIAGAIFNDESTEIIYNQISPYSLPISLNLISNAQLKYLHSENSIVTRVQPILEQKDPKPASNFFVAKLLFELIIPFFFALFTTSFLSFPLNERVSDSKHVQLMTGVSPVLYWLTIFLWDFLIFMIIACVVIAAVPLCDVMGHFSGSREVIAFAEIVILYGFSVLPQIYCFSLLVNSDIKGSIYFVLLHFCISVIFMLFLAVFSILPLTGIFYYFHKIPELLYFLLLASPQFLLFVCLKKFLSITSYYHNDNNNKSGLCFSLSKTGLDCARKPYEAVEVGFLDKDGNAPTFLSPGNGFGFELIVMFIDGIVYMLILILVDYAVCSRLRCPAASSNENQVACQNQRDEDVEKESEKINRGENNYFLKAQNLCKSYRARCTMKNVVDGVSFGVASGECFGLLGTNGAGKTTTFKILTGYVLPSRGSASVNGTNIRENQHKYLAYIGYCPQQNAFNPTMTAKEVLFLYARLRGVPKTRINEEVEYLLTSVGIKQYQHKRCGTYSGGNMRKLCIAIALIGDPPLLFLDEPTSGIDPGARRNVWGLLMAVQKMGHSIVLTSHSMDECEALCNRLTIMVAGKLRCLGEISRLKDKFGQGFTLMLKLKVDGVVEADSSLVAKVKARVESKFSPCELKHEHTGFLHYHIGNATLKWTFLFDTMEEMKTRLFKDVIDDYTISETTLEEVFLSFAKLDS